MTALNGSAREGDGPLNDSLAVGPESRSSDGASSEDFESTSLVDDVRAVVEPWLAGHLDEEQRSRFFAEMLALEKSAWGYCKKCKNDVKVVVPDAKAMLPVLTDLIRHARAAEGVGGGGTWSFENRVMLVGEEAS